MQFQRLPKLNAGDKVAIVSPSLAAPGIWPHVYELGVTRLREVFGLEAETFPATAKVGASAEERGRDLIDAFERSDIKAVITSLGGDDQITYAHRLPPEPFSRNPKPFFGYSDNTNFANFLWLQGVPSYYGGALFTEFAMHGSMDSYTVTYLKAALFEEATMPLQASDHFNDIGLNWNEASLLSERRRYQPNEGWYWDGSGSVSGITWGGCLESVDELFRHGVPIPSLEQFTEVVLLLETSEELPSADYVRRVLRAFGERGILERVRGLLVGRPKGWEFDRQNTDEEKAAYKAAQREAVLDMVRRYHRTLPVVQNVDFGHTAPQICMPYGGRLMLDTDSREITVQF